MEAYKVWATLNLKGDAHRKMKQFLDLVKKTNLELNKLIKTADKFSSTLLLLSNVFGKNNNNINIYNNHVERNVSIVNKATQANNLYATSISRVNNSIRTSAGKSGGSRSNAPVILGRGMGAAAGAYAGASLLKSSFHIASEFEKQRGLLLGQNIPGLTPASINNYVNNTKIPGASKMDLLEALSDAAVVTKEAHAALAIANTLVKTKLVGEGFGLEGFRMTKKQLQAAMKTAEIVSQSRDPNILNKHLEMMMGAWIATSGKVEPSQFLSIVRSSRGYAAGMDPKFFYYMLEPLIQEFGTRTGPMIAQFYQHMKVGRVTTQAAKILGQLGLVEPGAVELNKIGMIKGIQPGGIKGTNLAGRNIFDWIDQFLMPAMKRGGYDTLEKQSSILGKIFTNTDLTLVMSYLQSMEKIRGSAAINENVSSLDKMLDSMQKMHSGSFKVFSASFSDMLLNLDKVTGSAINATLIALSKFFDFISRVANFYGNNLSSKAPGSLTGASIFGVPTVDLTPRPANGNQGGGTGHVYLDSEKVGKVMFSNSSFNSNVQHGTTAVNSYSSPFSTALNYQGLQGI